MRDSGDEGPSGASKTSGAMRKGAMGADVAPRREERVECRGASETGTAWGRPAKALRLKNGQGLEATGIGQRDHAGGPQWGAA